MPDMRDLPVDLQEELLTLNNFFFDIPYDMNRQIRNQQIGSNIAIEYSNVIISVKKKYCIIICIVFFKKSHLNKLYDDKNNLWEHEKEHFTMSLISLIQNTDTNIEDITFNDIKYHYYNGIIGNIELND